MSGNAVQAEAGAVTGADPGALVEAAKRVLDKNYRRDSEIRAFPEIQAINGAPDDVRRKCILLAAADEEWPAARLLSYIARKQAGLSADDVEAILPPTTGLRDARDSWAGARKLAWLTGQIEATWKSLDDADRDRLRPQLERAAAETSEPGAAIRLRKLTAPEDGTQVPYGLMDDTSPAGKALRGAVGGTPESGTAKAALVRLLADYPMRGKPGTTWRKDATAVLTGLDDPGATIGALLDAALDAPDYHPAYPGFTHYRPWYVSDLDEAFLCGTTALAGLAAAEAPALLARLRSLALKSITAIGGEYGGPRSIRLANHCVKAIADAGLSASVTELLKTERGTRHGSLLRAVRAAIDTLAARQKITRDELLEMAVEDHGLAADGTRRAPLSDGWTALIEAGARSAALRYEDPSGPSRKSLPKTVKDESPEALRTVKTDLKALKTTIGNERARLDAALASDRSWTPGRWRELYLDHPVTGRLSRALIWRFGDGLTGIPADTNTVITSDGAEVPFPDDTTEVRLWHPVYATAGEVRAWRQLLIGRRLAQPVKQAFREVYVLTPAEEATRLYSNRFAGHVFRQSQARALMKGRGWKPVPLAPWDDGVDYGVSRRDYPSADGRPAVRAEFFFDYADEEFARDLFTYCASDQVRFFRAGSDDAMPLAEVAPLTFSEAMRDVDLFIGVTSVGADPEWNDHGEERRFAGYWHRFSFGDLSASAEVRREVLAGLVPLLAIAGRCDLQDRFLEVRGDLRTYRIHLGSGNILMSPNDQYLCIVAARDPRAGKLFLPFDDDPVLSIILSKAFLLAEDSKITDPAITRQIGGGQGG